MSYKTKSKVRRPGGEYLTILKSSLKEFTRRADSTYLCYIWKFEYTKHQKEVVLVTFCKYFLRLRIPRKSAGSCSRYRNQRSQMMSYPTARTKATSAIWNSTKAAGFVFGYILLRDRELSSLIILPPAPWSLTVFRFVMFTNSPLLVRFAISPLLV